MGNQLTVMRLFCCLSFPLPYTGGKGKTMKTPKTPLEFDYDLWTTEDGKCMVRIKETGETCEVSRDIMRLLRSEEKKLRRAQAGVPVSGCSEEIRASLLSLDYVSMVDAEGMSPAWLEAPSNLEEDVVTLILDEEFRKTLTPTQLDIYVSCILNGISYKDYADQKGVAYQSIQKAILLIRKKAQKFFK